MSRSIMAYIVSALFRLKPKPTESQAEKEIEKSRLKGEAEPSGPKGFSARYDNRVFYVNENTSSDYVVFYMHGGGFQHDFSPFHWKFIKKMIDETDAAVIAPAYHLIPFGTCQDAVRLIIPLYRKYTEEKPEKKFILMGDSSGGGLALALAECFKAEKARMPDEIILLSPWVDITMENPEISGFTGKDPWLTIPWLKVCGRHWAGSFNAHDYHVSPIFGDVSGLTNVTLFVGTRELFYPDIVRLCSMMEKEKTELIVGQDMIHVFPLLPIPEANEYCARIFDTIKRHKKAAVLN